MTKAKYQTTIYTFSRNCSNQFSSFFFLEVVTGSWQDWGGLDYTASHTIWVSLISVRKWQETSVNKCNEKMTQQTREMRPKMTGPNGNFHFLEPCPERQIFLAHLHKSTGRAIALCLASALVAALTKMLKFYVRVYKTLYFLNSQMDLVYIRYDYRCWSKILWSTIHTPANDLEVKVTDLEILCWSFVSKFLRSDRQAQVQASCPV